jgi:hypothetical protein
MVILLMVAGAMVFFAGFVWLAVKQQRRAVANLQALAHRLGLHCVGRDSLFSAAPQVQGTWQGRPVRFWNFSTGSGKSRQNWSAVAVQPRKTGAVTLELRRQGLATKVMEFFGASEVEVGDAAFDRAWFIQASHPVAVRAALVPEIRQRLTALDVQSRDGSYKLERGWMQFSIRGEFSNAALIARLEARLPVLADLADVVEVAADAPARR